MKKLILLGALLAFPLQAQILPSGAQRIQGADDPAVNRGYPIRSMNVDNTGAYSAITGGGTEYTEDAAAAANPLGGIPLCVRRDTLSTSEVSADGDNVGVKCDSRGQLYIHATDTDALLTTIDASASSTLTQATTTATGIGAPADSPWGGSGSGALIAINKAVYAALVDATAVAVTCSACSTSANQTTLNGYVDGLEGQTGIVTETAPATDTASSGLNGRLQRVAQRLTTLLPVGTTAAASSLGVTLSTEDDAKIGIVTETAPASDTASSGLNGRLQRIAQNLTTILNDTTTNPVGGPAAHDAAISGNPIRMACRALSSNYTAVSAGDVADCISTLTGVIVQRPYSLPGQQWSYAAATSGIANTTTAVTIQAAAGSGLKVYTTACQLSSDPLATATEFAIRDGAGGTVLWRLKIGTAGIVNGLNISFPSPISGTANTLLEVVTLTASVTGGVFVNCQGYTAP